MDEGDVITAVGVGTVHVEPNQVRVRVGVSTVAPTIAEALADAADAQRRLRGMLDELGLPRGAVQTTGYHGGTDHSERGTTRQRVDLSLSVVLPDVGAAGDVLGRMSTAVGAAFRIDGLTLEVAEPEPHRRTARAVAVGSARQKAEDMAAAAGVRLGRLRALVDGSSPGPTRAGGQLKAMSAPDVDGGELGISIAVTATYEIVQ